MQVDLSGFGPRYPQFPSDIDAEECSSCRTFQVEKTSHQVSWRESAGVETLPVAFGQVFPGSQAASRRRSSSKAESRDIVLPGTPVGFRRE